MKIKTLSDLSTILSELKKDGKSVGLITGCFDVLHYGHLSLFHYAKKRVDILVVGIDNDKSIKLSKGTGRPLFSEDIRAEMLAELESINYVFIIQEIFNFGTSKADEVQKNILKKIKPTHLITYIGADTFWKKKQQRTTELGINFLAQRKKPRISATSDIIHKLDAEL